MVPQFSASENLHQGCISKEANMEYFRIQLEDSWYLGDLKHYLFPLVQESSLRGCTTWNWDLKNKQPNLVSFLPEGILWEVEVTESFPASPVLEAAQQCNEDRFYLPSSLGHQYSILQAWLVNRIWVGAWKEAGETRQSLKGWEWEFQFEIHGFIKNNSVYQSYWC